MFWRMLVTKQPTVAIDFHTVFHSTSILYLLQQKKETFYEVFRLFNFFFQKLAFSQNRFSFKRIQSVHNWENKVPPYICLCVSVSVCKIFPFTEVKSVATAVRVNFNLIWMKTRLWGYNHSLFNVSLSCVITVIISHVFEGLF